MNNKQLDMVLDYLNEGTEIDYDAFLLESLIESFDKNINDFDYFVESSEIISEGAFLDKAKGILSKIWEFVKGAFEKVASIVKSFVSRIKTFIIKKKAEMQKKKVQKEAAGTVKIPYYVVNGTEVNLGGMEQSITKTLDYFEDGMKIIEKVIVDGIKEGNIEDVENIANNFKNGTTNSTGNDAFEIKYKEIDSKDPDMMKLEVANRLIIDFNVLYHYNDKVVKSTKNLIDNIRKQLSDESDQSTVHAVTRALSDASKFSNKIVMQRISGMQRLALSYLNIGKSEE